MALAILVYKGINGGQHSFMADIGSNRWFQFHIAKKKRKMGGLTMVDEETHASPMLESQTISGQILRTEFLFHIPASRFDRESRFVQLKSYATKDKTGPAFSKVITVIPSILDDENVKLPALILSTENKVMDPIQVNHKPFSYREPTVSKALFWSSIIGALPGLIDKAVPIVGKLLGGLGGGGANPSGGTQPAQPAPGQNIDISQIIKIITDLIGKSTTQSLYGGAMTIEPRALIQLAPLLEKILTPEAIQAIGDNPVRLFKAISDSILKMDQKTLQRITTSRDGQQNGTSSIGNGKSNGQYATAKIAPAVLAALPALAPLIEKALDPKMIEAIGNQPVKLFKAIGDAVLKMDQQEMEHLERLNPGVDDPAIDRLLASMSLAPIHAVRIPFEMDKKFDLKCIVGGNLIAIQGKQKLVYSKAHDLHFPFQIITQHANPPGRSFPKAIVQLIIQDGDSLEPVLEKKFRLKQVSINANIGDIFLAQNEIQGLPLNRDLKVELSFIWRSKRTGQNRGIFKNQYITLTENYLLGNIGDPTSEPIGLTDVVKYRPFWHKVWEGGFSESRRWNIEFDVKYYYALNTEDDNPAKMETRRRIDEDNAVEVGEEPSRRKIRAKLKSGMELTVEALNKLLPELSYSLLTEGQLQAIKTEGLESYFNQVARIHVELKGRMGDTATLWTYPEVTVYNFHLQKVVDVNESGQVTSTEPELIQFPRPTSIHFIGTKSE